jgi:type IV secretory pathway TrbL component
MRAIIILVVLAVLGFFGYQYAAEGRGPRAAIGVLTGATQEAERVAAEAAAAAAEEAAAADAEEAAAAAEEAAAAAAEEAAAAAAEEAAAAAEEAAAAAAEEAAAEATEEAVEEAAEAVEEAGDDLMTMADDLLTLDGFDAEKVTQLLEGSDIPDDQKTAMTSALDFAKDNPALLQPVLDSIRGLLGL